MENVVISANRPGQTLIAGNSFLKPNASNQAVRTK